MLHLFAMAQALLVQPMSSTIYLVGCFSVNCVFWFCSLLLPYDSALTVPIFVLGSGVFGWLLATVMHRYVKEFELMQSQLRGFSFMEASCWCCTVNHQTQGGEKIPCDRDIIGKCIQHWFGSVKDFEDLVQTRVKDALTVQSGGYFCSYPLVVVATLPLMWAQQDNAAARVAQQDSQALSSIVVGLVALFIASPLAAYVILISIRGMSRFCRSTMLQKFMASLVSTGTTLGQQLLLQICNEWFGRGSMLAVLGFGALQLLPCILIWYAARRFVRLRS